jgi:hypothetical protein
MTIRRYHWQTDRSKEQISFLTALLKVYRTYTKGQSPELVNFPPPPESRPVPTASISSDKISHASAYDGHITPISPSVAPSGLDLRPPQLPKTQRSGSSSSFASAQSSSYQSEQGQGSRSRLVDQRQHAPRAESFSRSPLADSNIPPARTSFERRPSGDARSFSNGNGRVTPGVASGSPYGNGTVNGLGLGVPISGPGRTGERPSHPQREQSESSNYPDRPDRPDRAHRPSMEFLQQTDRPISPASSEKPARPSRGAPGTSVDMFAKGSGTGSGTRDQAPPSASDRNDNVPPPLHSQLAPIITTTLPSPGLASAGTLTSTSTDRKPTRRASFHPPPLTTAFSREVLLTSRTGLLPGAGVTVEDGEAKEDAVMASVEEMLEGFDWTAQAADGEGGVKKRGADAIEGRLLDELAALDSVSFGVARNKASLLMRKANIHAFLESDDRTAQVLGHIDEALLELEDIDMQLTGYRVQLNVSLISRPRYTGLII